MNMSRRYRPMIYSVSQQLGCSERALRKAMSTVAKAAGMDLSNPDHAQWTCNGILRAKELRK